MVPSLTDIESALGQLDKMQAALRHRGPDDFGTWNDAKEGIFLGHRRLSILDLTQSGHQPKISASGRYIIAFNGEIYNHLQLRARIDSETGQSVWEGHSDTETLLAAIEHWGLEQTLRNASGMFAIALWDRKLAALSLSRDRMGEKPLYFGWQGAGADRVFLFGSELKALNKHSAFEAEIDRQALTLFMRYNYVPAPHSIWTGIKKLAPGTILTLSAQQPEGEVITYWSFAKAVQAGSASRFEGTREEAVDVLHDTLVAAVDRQMISDVPLGAFLSGGIDSSAVVAIMQQVSNKPARTFTIGYDNQAYDESVYAKDVARHLNTEHHEFRLAPQDALNVIPALPEIYCEPFSDSSQIPTYLVSRFAREHVTVALSGDAGDELFGGYNRYLAVAKNWTRIAALPLPVRVALGDLLMRVPPHLWDSIGGSLAKRHFRTFGDKVHKAAAALSASSVQALHHRLASAETEPVHWVKGGSEPLTLFDGLPAGIGKLDDIEQMMAIDALTYLPDDILTKVDRAAMAVSLETRVPFLDPAVIEFACSLPIGHKIVDGVTKWPLRELLYRYVPRSLLDRPKMGFGIPVADWLRGPLREWAEDLLDARRLDEEGYWHVDIVQSAWQTHLSGRQNLAPKLWSVLMFQAWLRHSKS